MKLGGKVALITGAARGIGKAYAECLLTHGAKVAIADILDDCGQQTAREFTESFGAGRVIFIQGDITKTQDCERTFSETLAKFGWIDILINNAGVALPGWSLENMMAVNLFSMVTMCEMAIERMRKDGSGHGGVIINISSIAGIDVCVGSALEPYYATTKHAVTGYTRGLAANVKRHLPDAGLRVYCVAPTWVKTDMTTRFQDLEMVAKVNPPLLKFIHETGGFFGTDLMATAILGLLQNEPEGDFLLVSAKGQKFVDFTQLWQQ